MNDDTLDMFAAHAANDTAPAARLPPKMARLQMIGLYLEQVGHRPVFKNGDALEDPVVARFPNLSGMTSEWAERALASIFSVDRKKYLSALPDPVVTEILAASWVYSCARDVALKASHPAAQAADLLRGHRNRADPLNAALCVMDRHQVAGGDIPLRVEPCLQLLELSADCAASEPGNERPAG